VHEYDVAIIGGRPAGASLAARLGDAGMKVLVIDKDTFPSRPPVSAPFALPHTLALLDEIGVPEAEYAHQTPIMHEFVLEFANYFRARFRFERSIAGRKYFYAVDRARFDHAIWRSLARYPSVTALERARAGEIQRDTQGRVVGVQVIVDGESRDVQARAIIGADGRHSMLARAVGAAVTDERKDVDTTLYYAHWRDVAAYAPGDPLAHIHTSCDGFSFVFMPTADGETMVVAQGRSDSYEALTGTPDAVYEQLLRARPLVWRRLAHARQVSELSGIKRMGNLFRAHGGPGWALVGDAFHQKDSIDAQGIYDALLGAKLLAEQLIEWHRGACSWEQAIERYGTAANNQLAPMFEATMARVKREIYDSPPPAAAKTLLRWVLTHPEYGRRFEAMVTRQLDPTQFLTPPILLSLAAKGAMARARAKLRRGEDPTDPLLVP
jgi:2-polyprenyl-6-methoxyphenol hydroxylase-like FAD-dependent oxidoreductase